MTRPQEGQENGALYQAETPAPPAYQLAFLLPVLGSIGALVPIVAAGFPRTALLVPALSTLVLIPLWASLSILRIRVSTAEIRIRHRLFGPRIPAKDIESCEVVDYPRGRFGVRYGSDGSVAYELLGAEGRAVRIAYKKRKATRTVLVASRDPERLAAAIAEARAAAITNTNVPQPTPSPGP